MGRPTEGIIYDNMRSSKRLYTYAVRRHKRHLKEIQYQKMAQSINANQSRDFFKELKRVKSSKSCTAACINGENDSAAVAQLFADKYTSLFNSVPSNPEGLNDIDNYIQDSIKQEPCSSTIINKDMITAAVKRLKSEKADGDRGLYSNHIKYATDLYLEELAGLFSAVLIHGHLPGEILKSTITSIPKDANGDMCSDGNYRGIALMSCMAKLFDIVILMRNETALATSDLQFAFKPKLGTTLCTLVMKEIIKYYMQNGATVYGCLLDATKAFDRVRFDKLFLLLIKRKMNAIDLRALKDLYLRQCTRTTWKGHYSSYFTTTNGIRQGSIASPTLFCVYMDELLQQLKAKGVGCWIGRHFVGAISYADDLTLLCPSIQGLQLMLNVCEAFAQQYGMQYNPDKSICINFCKKTNVDLKVKLTVAGKILPWSTKVKHLGNILTSNLSEGAEIMHKKGDFIGRINALVSTLNTAPEEVILPLFQAQCCHLYGCQAWNLADSKVQQIFTTWNRGVRRMLKLPWLTHRRFLPHIAGLPSAEVMVYRRFVKMARTMISSTNEIVNFIAAMCIKSKDSIMGQNLEKISCETNIDISQVLSGRPLELAKFDCSIEDHAAIQAIKDLRDNSISFPESDIHCFITFLCNN